MVSSMFMSMANCSSCTHSICYSLYSYIFLNYKTVLLWVVICPAKKYLPAFLAHGMANEMLAEILDGASRKAL